MLSKDIFVPLTICIDQTRRALVIVLPCYGALEIVGVIIIISQYLIWRPSSVAQGRQCHNIQIVHKYTEISLIRNKMKSKSKTVQQV